MKLVLQRVRESAVRVSCEEVARIGRGLLILAGVEKGDSEAEAERLARKVAALRIFEDGQGKMNLSPADVGAEVLVVSQFTLAADLSKGNRPSFDPAETPEAARGLLVRFCEALARTGLTVRQGRFGERMEVELVNDGPVTFLL